MRIQRILCSAGIAVTALVTPVAVGTAPASAQSCEFLQDCLFQNVIDPTVCPVFTEYDGSYAGVVTVGPNGDIYVIDPLDLNGGAPIYDCPPYGDY